MSHNKKRNKEIRAKYELEEEKKMTILERSLYKWL